MPTTSAYRLFLSHSWAYTDAYDKLLAILKNQPHFAWSNYSVPRNDPIHNAGSDAQLYAAIKRQIAPTHCILILAGVYATYSKWINKEIQIATEAFQKPIVAVEPWGAERTSKIVKENADRIVRWNGSSIVQAIREVTR